ncbi:MAG: cyclase family protein [Anaerolineales bacterium]
MPIYDITLTISPSMPVWPGDPAVELTQTASIDQGANANVSQLNFGLHTGTHVDAPHHFLNDRRTVESLPLDVLTGRCYVLHLDDNLAAITADALEAAQLPEGVSRLLFRTRNSDLWTKGVTRFQTAFVAVTLDGAEWLVRRGIKLVGVDYLSVAPYKNSRPTHVTLLQAGVVILEGLDLSQVAQGFYDLYCLPLKVANSDGAPARTILVG